MFVRSLCSAAAVLFAVVITGCTTTYKDANGEYLQYPANAGTSEYYTQYSIGTKRISGEGRASVVFGLIHSGDGKYCALGANPNLTFFDMLFEIFSPTSKAILNAKSSAVYNAVEKNKADYLVGAMFSYTVRNYLIFSEVECTITAYPAFIKKISPAKKIILNSNQRIVSVNPDMDIKDYSAKNNSINVNMK